MLVSNHCIRRGLERLEGLEIDESLTDDEVIQEYGNIAKEMKIKLKHSVGNMETCRLLRDTEYTSQLSNANKELFVNDMKNFRCRMVFDGTNHICKTIIRIK